jgi:predicted nucleic acid-binding protein
LTRLTLDASVICKWFLQNADNEPFLQEAENIAVALDRGRIAVTQPPHWIAEVLGVVVRRRPELIEWSTARLLNLELAVTESSAVYRRGARLAADTGAHIFDTLYHAAALETGATLVTADLRYLKLATGQGSIVALAEFTAL